MFSPADFLATPSWPFLDLKSIEATEAIRELHGALKDSAAVTVPDLFLKDLLARHQLAPAALNADLAMPHARTNAVREIVLAVGRSQVGVKFDEEHEAVRLVFLIGTPKESAFEYLRLLATLTRVLHPADTRESLLAAADGKIFRTGFTAALKSVAV